jgi:hypothetical protein
MPVVGACAICDGPGEGCFFGAFSCRSCAAFFRRSVRDGRQYQCRANGDCSINEGRYSTNKVNNKIVNGEHTYCSNFARSWDAQLLQSLPPPALPPKWDERNGGKMFLFVIIGNKYLNHLLGPSSSRVVQRRSKKADHHQQHEEGTSDSLPHINHSPPSAFSAPSTAVGLQVGSKFTVCE